MVDPLLGCGTIYIRCNKHIQNNYQAQIPDSKCTVLKFKWETNQNWMITGISVRKISFLLSTFYWEVRWNWLDLKLSQVHLSSADICQHMALVIWLSLTTRPPWCQTAELFWGLWYCSHSKRVAKIRDWHTSCYTACE